jgi:hypothetical protein
MCDMLLLGAAIQPVVPGTKVGYMASLDHSMWFHNPFRANEWMLYEIECPQCGMYLFINKYFGDIHVLRVYHGRNRIELDLLLPVQSVSITTIVVSLNPTHSRCTRYNCM